MTARDVTGFYTFFLCLEIGQFSPRFGAVSFLICTDVETKAKSTVGVQETVLLGNHARARGTPAIFVIFAVSRGSSSKALVLLVRMQIRHFRHFRQKPPFSGRTKARFTKSTVFGTPTLEKVQIHQMETAPRNCRFLSLVVVERVLTRGKRF